MAAGLRKIPALGKLGPTSPAGSVAKPPPPPTGPRPLPDLAMPVGRPRGPLHLGLGQKRRTGAGGPGDAPADFGGSQPEWVWHWASRKYFYSRERIDPRQPPFDGGISWQFQVEEGGRHTRAAGASVTDFVYLGPGANVLVRIEGTYFHLEQGGAQQARDLYLIAQAGLAGDRVVRVNDTQFMGDATGATAIRLLADVLANRAPIGQAQGGVVLPPRYADFVNGVSA